MDFFALTPVNITHLMHIMTSQLLYNWFLSCDGLNCHLFELEATVILAADGWLAIDFNILLTYTHV
jgi:hypothetical protein